MVVSPCSTGARRPRYPACLARHFCTVVAWVAVLCAGLSVAADPAATAHSVPRDISKVAQADGGGLQQRAPGSPLGLRPGVDLTDAERRALKLLASAVRPRGPVWRSQLWEQLSGNNAAPAGENAPAPRASRGPARAPVAPVGASLGSHRRAQQIQSSAGAVLGSCVNDSDTSDNTLSDFTVKIEVDESSDLNLLTAHIGKILLQDKMSFRVELLPRLNAEHALARLADNQVHLNFQVGLEEQDDYLLYRELVEKDELVLDMGATGYSTASGLFVANGQALAGALSGQVGDEPCLYPDHWKSFTNPAVLEQLLSVHDVFPGVENGSTVCNASLPGQGFCSNAAPLHAGKYFSTSACDANGYSVRNSSFACRALIAHYPRYHPAVLEQLVNNLGRAGFEFGVVWLGASASAEIANLAMSGKAFMFNHWYPSTLMSDTSVDFKRLDLPAHDRAEWLCPGSALPSGPITSSFLPTAGLKLMRADVATHTEIVNGTADQTGPLLKEFVQRFSLLQEHVDTILAMSHETELAINFTCTGLDDTPACRTTHEQIACAWVQENEAVWNVFLPAHRHCNPGQHVDVTTSLVARCVDCELGRFMDHSNNLHQCVQCPAGQFADALGMQRCSSCSAGKFGSTPEATSALSCIDCDPGRYQSDAAQTGCDPCAPGEFQAASGKPYCHACSTGEYQPSPTAVNCSSCDPSARACTIVQDPDLRVQCKYRQASDDTCTCNAGTFGTGSEKCSPCPEGAFCCMCPEVAACYDASFGVCNDTKLRENIKLCNSTCCDGAVEGQLFTSSDPPSCVSGSPKPLAMPGYFEKKFSTASGNSSEFLACSLVLPTTKLRTAVDWDYMGCLGGPTSDCAEGNTGHLCATCEDDSWYMVQLGRCRKCDSQSGARTLVKSLLIAGFVIVIPLLFNGIYFSVSDKSAAQYMVYMRLVIDTCVVLYLIYSSLFRYWPSHLLSYTRTDGHSKLEDWNSFFYGFECGFGWGFEVRYYTYLLLPFILILGLSVQICFVWFVYTFDDTELRIDGYESEEQLSWKQTLLEMGSAKRKEWITIQHRAEDSIRVPTQADLDAYQELKAQAAEHARLKAGLAAVHSEAMEEQHAVADLAGLQISDELAQKRRDAAPPGNCLNTVARALTKRLPDSRTERGARIAFAPPKDGDAWQRFVNHSTQVYVFLLVMLYISLVNYALTVFDCSSFNKDAETGSDLFMEWEPTIRCSWDDPVWARAAVIGGLLGGVYTVMIPGGLLMVFMANADAARRGDMQYMQRFGFLLKPYKPEAYYWEIVNMARKALLSFIVKLNTSTPFMCGAYALAVLCVIIANQAYVRPYKYDKHNTCAVWVLTLGAVNFFSSLVFITDVASGNVKGGILGLNILGVMAMLVWVIGGAVKDIWMYLRMQLFVLKCEIKGRAALEIETMWLVVDKPGLVSLKWYDTLVMRNRYSHMVARSTIQPEGGKAGATRDSDSKKVETRLAVEDQNAAHSQWLAFHEGFARFVAEVSPRYVHKNFVDELAQRDKQSKSAAQMFNEMDADGSGSLELPEITELCYRLNPKLKLKKKDLKKIVEEMDIDGDGEVDLKEFTRWWAGKGFADNSDTAAGSSGAPVEEVKATKSEGGATDAEPTRRGFKHLESVAMLLEQLYTTRNLAKMVLYMEFVIKYDLADKFELATVGPSDVASHMIQFTREFAEAIAGGGAGAAAAAAASQEGFGDEPGEAAAGASGDAAVDGNKLADKLYVILRPHRSLGIDTSMFHRDGKAVQRHPIHGRRSKSASDFANPMFATNFQLQNSFGSVSVVA